MSRKPEVFRGLTDTTPPSGGMTVCQIIIGSPNTNCLVVPDGAVMPLDETTERLVLAVRRWSVRSMRAHDIQLREALAAFDAERKGTT